MQNCSDVGTEISQLMNVGDQIANANITWDKIQDNLLINGIDAYDHLTKAIDAFNKELFEEAGIHIGKIINDVFDDSPWFNQGAELPKQDPEP